MTGTVLILGGNGRFGRNVAEAFWNAGWTVRLFDRGQDDLQTAAQGVDVIVNGWNPAYPDWAAQLPGLTRQVIAAARASGATVIQPGNVYVFGMDASERFGPDAPHGATNPLGRLKIEMEAALRDSGVRVVMLRCGDFLDTAASGNWFDRIMAPSLKRGLLTYPGRDDVDHAWAFLPDVGRAAVLLAERRDSLPRVLDLPFPGYTLSGAQLAEGAARVLDRPVRIRRMAWWPLLLARPFWRTAVGLTEMRYLWNKPHHLDPAPFHALLPAFRDTPVDEALRAALDAVGTTRPKVAKGQAMAA